MSDKTWGISLIITSAVLFAAITVLLYTLRTPDVSPLMSMGARVFAVFACILQLVVFILFARSMKKKK